MASADERVKEQIREVIARKTDELTSTDNLITEKYLLTFTISDKDESDLREFKTIFSIGMEDGANFFANKCVSLTGLSELSSSLEANNPEKQCFDPILTRASLPTDVTPTDVLQVLSTKLKMTVLTEKKKFAIFDVATITNPDTRKPFKTMISKWRLVRGELTLYEKYGYTNMSLPAYRDLVQKTPWSAIAGYEVGEETLEDITSKYFPGKFDPEKSIAECMRNVSLTDTDTFSIEPLIMAHDKKTIVILIMDALKALGHPIPSFVVTVSRNNEVWKSWDKRLLFLSFDKIPEETEPTTAAGITGGGSAAAVGGARRTKKHKRNKRRSLNMVNVTHRYRRTRRHLR